MYISKLYCNLVSPSRIVNENKKNQSYEPYPYQLSSLGFSPKFFRSIIQANRYNNY